MPYKRITIVRLLGPSLPPLQGPNQQSYNLQFLIDQELEVQKSSSCIRKLWVITCMYNKTEEALIVDILKDNDQEYYHVPGCSKKRDKKLYGQLKDVNIARNFAIEKALIEPSDWILPLDGNIFIPKNALENIVNGLIVDHWLGKQVHAIPLFRILGCQSLYFNDSFRFDREMQNSYLQLSGKFPTISEFLSRKQEGQIAVATTVPNITLFFSPKQKYGAKSKLGLIQKLKSNQYHNSRCGYNSGYEFNARTASYMLYHSLSCGYVLRLVYWPAYDNCSHKERPVFPELPKNASIVRQKAKILKNRTEVNAHRRANQRIKSMKRLKKLLLKDDGGTNEQNEENDDTELEELTQDYQLEDYGDEEDDYTGYYNKEDNTGHFKKLDIPLYFKG